MTTTPTSPSLRHEVQNYIRYLHIACNHEYRDDGTDIRGKQLLTLPHINAGSAFRTFFILTPRWCPRCRDERAQNIRASYRGRVADADAMPVGTEEDGYICGVRDGRISALSHPLPEFEQHTTSSITFPSAPPEIEILSQILTALEFNPSKIKRDNENPMDINNELSQKLQDQLVLTDEKDDELKHAIFWHLAYMEGVKDGCAMQAELEDAAMREEEDTVRDELMGRALL